MKLKYRILWFEDSVSWYAMASRNLNDFLDENGFTMVADRYDNDNDGIKKILDASDYDLILMDLNLEGVRGDKIIEEIRNFDFYTEIVFYSQSDVKTIRSTIRDKGIDGLYCTSRNNEEFEEKVTKIIKNSIKKVQDVNNMRGLVIAQAIDLESKIKIMLKRYFATGLETPLNEVRTKIYSKICEKKVEQFESEKALFDRIHAGGINSLIEQDILTSNNLYHALQSIMKEDLRLLNAKLTGPLSVEERKIWEEKKQENISLKEQLKKYDDEIIKLRNTLAHVTEKVNEEGIPYLESRHRNGTIIIFNNEKYIEIRKVLKNHIDNLDKIDRNLFADQDILDEAAPTALN